MRLVNTSSHRIRIAEFGGLDLGPGDEVEIDDGYCRSRRLSSGAREPSLVEQLLPSLAPVDPALRATWKQVPEAPGTVAPTPAETAARLEQEQGLPPAVAALVAAGAAEPPKRRRRAGSES